MTGDARAVVEARRVSKRFGSVEVLRDVSVEFFAGTVHAVCGENGAGKSTLLKIVSGIHRPSSGSIFFGGSERRSVSVAEARKLGVISVLQDPILVPTLSVAENLLLGRLPHGAIGRVKSRALTRHAEALLERYELGIRPGQLVSELPLGKRRILEIVRAADLEPSLIILDEPTASLSESDVEMLGGVVRRLREAGAAVAYVSHRLREILSLCDTATVLRDGALISTRPTAGMTTDELATLMIGKEFASAAPGRTSERTRPPKDDRGASGMVLRRFRTYPTTPEMSLAFPPGVVTGLYGLVGSGRTSLAKALAGLRTSGGGEVTLGGRPYRARSSAEAGRRGVFYCPEDRKNAGLFLGCPVAENVSAAVLKEVSGHLGMVARRQESALAMELCEAVRLRPLDIAKLPKELSGGNQQKVLLARYFATRAAVLILDEPTVGVDVQARRDIHDLIRERLSGSVSIVVISSDPEEIVELCDRAYVLRDGGVVGALEGEMDSDRLASLSLSGELQPSLPGVR